MKARLIIITTISISFIFTGFAQELQTEWITNAGGSSYDQANALGFDTKGNFFVTGYFQGKASFGTKKVDSHGDTDVYLAKYNVNGELDWVQTGGSDYNKENVVSEFGTALAIDKTGNVLIAGTFRREAYFGNQKITSAGKDDIFLAKYSESGDLLWLKKAGGKSQDVVQSIATDELNNIYVTGYFQNEASFENTIFRANEYANFFISKYSPQGNLVWIKDSKQTGATTGNSIVIFKNEIFVTGNFEGNLTLGNCSVRSSGNRDIFIAKLSTEGHCNFLTRTVEIGDEIVNDMDVTENGIFLTGGYREIDAQSKDYHGFVSELSLLGDQVWIKKFKGVDTSEGKTIQSIGKERIIVAGYFLESIDIDGNRNIGNKLGDIFLTELNSNGEIIWTDVHQGEGKKSFNDMATTDKFIVLAGTVEGSLSDGDITINSLGKSDIYLKKIQVPTIRESGQAQESGIKIFPNPSNGQFNLSYHFSKPQSRNRIIITDVNGKKVYENFLNEVEQIDLPISLADVVKGVYNIQVISEEIELYRKILIIK